MKRLLSLLLMLMMASGFVPALAEDWRCPECSLMSSGNYCPWCGAKKPVYVECPECGEAYAWGLGYIYCPNCGAALKLVDSLLPTALSVGDIITFGHYEQDGDAANGQEAIEWQVLETDGSTATLISRYGLAAKTYHFAKLPVTWEHSTLRSWLNDDFLNAAFDAEEQAIIETASVPADPHPEYDTDPGNDTQDRVWLLSMDEAARWFPTEPERVCAPTKATELEGAGAYVGSEGCWWLLRTPGSHSASVAYVRHYGNFNSGGVSYVFAVRPAIKVRLG